MKAKTTMDKAAKKNGWSVAQQLALALEYIDDLSNNEAFQDFLEFDAFRTFLETQPDD